MGRPLTILNACAAALALTIPDSVAAQSQGSGAASDAAGATRASQPALVLRTAERGPVLGFGHAFDLVGGLPELEPGQHWVAAVDSDRRVTVRAASGQVGHLVLEVDPGATMELFADEIGEVRGLVQGFGVLAMTQYGMKAPDAVKLFKSVFEFPYTLESARVAVLSDPQDYEDNGFELECSITAKAGSAFGGLLTKIKPSALGAPQLSADPGRVMECRIAVAPESLDALLGPFLEFGLAFGFPDAEARAEAAKMSRAMMAMYDGGLVVGFDQNMRMAALYGFRAGQSPAELIASEDYQRMIAAQDLGRNVEIEVERDAMEHAGVKFTRMSLYNEGPPNPMMPNDEMHQFIGGTGDLLVVGGSKAIACDLVERVAAGQGRRKPLEDGAIASFRMDLRRMIGAMGQAIPKLGPGAKEIPGDVVVRTFVADRTIRVAVTVR